MKQKGTEVKEEIKSTYLDFKGKLQDAGMEEEGKTFHSLQVLGMNDDLWIW